jgi:hypothetical protein
LDLQQAKVTVAAVGQGVGLTNDRQVAGSQGAFDLLNQSVMRDGRPGGRGAGRVDQLERRAFDGLGATVEDEIALFHGRGELKGTEKDTTKAGPPDGSAGLRRLVTDVRLL